MRPFILTVAVIGNYVIYDHQFLFNSVVLFIWEEVSKF
uniref:Uncharacterized protein n=1 Tax=Siphoviridae sp. ctiOl67 TaxID=2825622 RepID=A0A8S5QJ37_9CAUD|nr:MAG TPA: hypothetical protein [Siphoviridae sp. ctiOl67]